MPTNRESGDKGEKEIIELIACPNCSKSGGGCLEEVGLAEVGSGGG